MLQAEMAGQAGMRAPAKGGLDRKRWFIKTEGRANHHARFLRLLADCRDGVRTEPFIRV